MGGVAVMTLGQAEVFAAYGCRDITVVNTAVTPAKLRRLCALPQQADLTVVADHPSQLQRMAEAAQDQGIVLRVLVQVGGAAQTDDPSVSSEVVGLWHKQLSTCPLSTLLELPHLPSR